MWSLPDITRLNSEAHARKRKLETAVRTGKLDGTKLVCEYADHDDPSTCSGQLYHSLIYDIFSDDPKGVLTLCEHHEGYYGSPSEGYFTCDDCQRVMVDNYTWELYYIADKNGNQLCLPCAAREYIADEGNWIRLTDEDIAVITFDVVRKAKHVIGVEMPVPKSIQFLDSITFDSSTGGAVRGFSTADDTPDAGVAELRAILGRAKAEGHQRAILILDGGYQFAVSIGVYVDAPVPAKRKRRTVVAA